MADHAGDYTWHYLTSVEDHHGARREAADRFSDDLALHPGAYLAAALPNLPFADRSFDLVLSSHLLFIYEDRLDRDFHQAAIRELVRVSRDSVRIFPIVDLAGVRYAGLEQMRGRLKAAGVVSEVHPVDYRFPPGATEMLVCRRG